MNDKEKLSFTGNINQLEKYGSGGSGVIVYHREPIESARDIYHRESTEREHAGTGSKAARKECLSVKCFNGETAVKAPKKRRKV